MLERPKFQLSYRFRQGLIAGAIAGGLTMLGCARYGRGLPISPTE
jgi:hypothetical protein